MLIQEGDMTIRKYLRDYLKNMYTRSVAAVWRCDFARNARLRLAQRTSQRLALPGRQFFNRPLRFSVLAGMILACASCGKKGDLLTPVIPQPLPVQAVSAALTDQGIVLTWRPPAGYSSGKPLALLNDIQKITITRKIEPSTNSRWDFSGTREGWTAAAKTLPVKWHKGILRAASKEGGIFLVSPANLGLQAETTAYIRLKLWSKHSDRGYVAFITDSDSAWNTAMTLAYQPAVYTSFYTYQRSFHALKLAPFLIDTDAPGQPETVREYLIDMRKIPTWKGRIQQIGVFLRNAAPAEALVEIGLEQVELTNTSSPVASVYDSPPWLFEEDEEGWIAQPAHTLLGAADGVLYAQSAGMLLLRSASGQNLPRDTIRQIRIRMQVSAGDMAYAVLLNPLQERNWAVDGNAFDRSAPYVIPIALQDAAAFHTYTLDIPSVTEKETGLKFPGEEQIALMALVFPELPGVAERHILIDSITMLTSAPAPDFEALLPASPDISSLPELAARVRENRKMRDPDLTIPYQSLTAAKETVVPQIAKLAEVSPRKPDPVVIQADGLCTLTDAGRFKDAPLRYGERYTYTIDVTDRKNQKNSQSGSVTIEYVRAPAAPQGVRAESDEKGIRLTWNRPFLTQDGKKIRSLAGYRIFRTSRAGQYENTLIYTAAPSETVFLDQTASPGTPYYYVVQALASTTAGNYVGGVSQEVAATLRDRIPPAIPSNLTGVYADHIVTLYWNMTATADWAGFNVYRSQSPDKDFRRMNNRPVLHASYQDTTVEANAIYYYYVTSFDQANPPNESAASTTIPLKTGRFK